MIFPGSNCANGFRHNERCSERAVVSPVAFAVRSSVTAPACDTTPVPVASTDRVGYDDVDLLTRKTSHVAKKSSGSLLFDRHGRGGCPCRVFVVVTVRCETTVQDAHEFVGHMTQGSIVADTSPPLGVVILVCAG